MLSRLLRVRLLSRGYARALARFGLVVAACGAVTLPGHAADNGYATAVRAEYVFACMSTNGGGPDALQRCSCAIDVIASVLPYSEYEKAETVLRMRRSAGGYLAQEFRGASSNAFVRDLEEAEAEAEVRCF